MPPPWHTVASHCFAVQAPAALLLAPLDACTFSLLLPSNLRRSGTSTTTVASWAPASQRYGMDVVLKGPSELCVRKSKGRCIYLCVPGVHAQMPSLRQGQARRTPRSATVPPSSCFAPQSNHRFFAGFMVTGQLACALAIGGCSWRLMRAGFPGCVLPSTTATAHTRAPLHGCACGLGPGELP